MSINITDQFHHSTVTLFKAQRDHTLDTQKSDMILSLTTSLKRHFPEAFVFSNSLAQKTYGKKRHFLNWKCYTKRAVLVFGSIFSVCMSKGSGKC